MSNVQEERVLSTLSKAIYRTEQGVPVTVEGPYTPEYATDGAAGFDLRANIHMVLGIDPLTKECTDYQGNYTTVQPGETKKIPTGLKFKIPHGYEIQIRPRSGNTSKGLVAHFGTVDSDYRGEVMVIVHNNGHEPWVIEHGDRIAQGVLAPVTRAYFVSGVVDEDTDRGSGGFGSTGHN